MKKFFDEYLNFKKMAREKREYKQFMSRVDNLPSDYAFVFKKTQEYMWQFCSGAGYDMMELQKDLLELFESGAISQKPVLDITGNDVAGFVEELLRHTNTWNKDWKEKLNREIQSKIADI